MLCSDNFMRKDLNTSKGKEPAVTVSFLKFVAAAWKLWAWKFNCKSRWESEVSLKKSFARISRAKYKKSTTLKGREISERSSFQDCVLNLLQDTKFLLHIRGGVHFWFLVSFLLVRSSFLARREQKKVKISESLRSKVYHKMQVKFLFMFFPASCVCLLLSWWMKKLKNLFYV